MRNDAEVTDAGDGVHWRGRVAGRSTERKGALCAADASLRRRDAEARLACGQAA